MDTPVAIPGLTVPPFAGEPIIMGIDLASGPDQSAWVIVYTSLDGTEIIGCGMGELTKDKAEEVVAKFADISGRKGRKHGTFEARPATRCTDKG